MLKTKEKHFVVVEKQCGNCQLFDRRIDGERVCLKLNETNIENPVVSEDSMACNAYVGMPETRNRSIFFGLITING